MELNIKKDLPFSCKFRVCQCSDRVVFLLVQILGFVKLLLQSPTAIVIASSLYRRLLTSVLFIVIFPFVDANDLVDLDNRCLKQEKGIPCCEEKLAHRILTTNTKTDFVGG